MNLRLFLLLIFVKSLIIIGGFFGLGLFFFLHFGSGASATSDKAIITENIAIIILVSLPLLFGLFKYKTLIEKQRGKSYFFAGLIVTIVSGIYFGQFIY